MANQKKSDEVSVAMLNKFLDTLPKSLTANEKAQFLNVAQAFNLNPYKREIYVVAYGKDDNRQFSLITGYEVYIKRGERTGLLDGFRVWTEGEIHIDVIKVKRKQSDGTYKEVDQNIWMGDLVAKIEIHRKDWTKPFTWEVEFDEYNGKNQMWYDKPKTMIKKVVVGQGFRLCFADDFKGMPYLAEEIRTEDAVAVEVTAEDELNVAKKRITDALEKYKGKDKESIRQSCNDAVISGNFTQEFAKEIGSQLGLEL